MKGGRSLLLAAGLALVASAHAAPGAPDEQAAVESARRAQVGYFRDDPFSPVRAVRRYDFPEPASEGTASAAVFGSGKEADLRLDAPGIPARLLRLTVLPPEKEGEPSRFRLERLADQDDLRLAGEPFKDKERTVPE